MRQWCVMKESEKDSIRLPAGCRSHPHACLGPLLLGGFLLFVTNASATVLPEDRSDLMYHSYDGGGVKVSGPAVLVRKSVGDSVSLYGRYYVDTVSSASIDVVTTASPYTDKREEYQVGIDFLHGNTLMGMSFSNSKESDYIANTINLNISQDLFDGLTTVSMGYSQGYDTIEPVNSFDVYDINRYKYRLGLTQVLTPTVQLGVSYEGIAEEGYLNNPYRYARVLGALVPERYPNTHDSQALAVRLIKGNPSDARAVGESLRGDYRYYRDNWGITSNTLGLAYQRYFGTSLLGEVHYRYYKQSAATFYSDNFTTEMTYMARDKLLSAFTDNTLGFKATWYFLNGKYSFVDRMSLNFAYDYIYFNYDNFTDVRTGQLYSFGANVLQLFISAWY
jgi:hypothetical protein